MTWLDALGWAGSALLVFSLAQARVLRFRVLNLIACVVLVGSNHGYLRVLRVHHADILRFQPDFVWDGAEDGRSAYLVHRGDETGGGVLIRDAGNGEAQIELDYLTPRFRDFSPGEFVWRRSRLLRNEGFKRVVTSPNMVAPYYDKVGFRRQGEAFVPTCEASSRRPGIG